MGELTIPVGEKQDNAQSAEIISTSTQTTLNWDGGYTVQGNVRLSHPTTSIKYEGVSNHENLIYNSQNTS